MNIFTPRKDSKRNGLRKTLFILGSLFFVLPFMILSYIVYQNDIQLNGLYLFVLVLLLVLILAGLMVLRYLVESLISIAQTVKKGAEGGAIVSAELKHDVSELHQISSSFNTLMLKFERTTEELSRRTSELDTIRELTEIANNTTDIDNLLRATLDKASTVVRAQSGSVFAVDSASGHFHFVGSKGLNSAENDSSSEITTSLVEKVISEGTTIFFPDINTGSTAPDLENTGNVQSSLVIPLFIGGNVAAVFVFQNKGEGELFNNDDERILFILLGEMSFALKNEMLHSNVKSYLKEIQEHNIRINQEIYERKLAGKQLKESLNEKKVLRHEIHHRVRNNLQVISSLLSLQSQYIKDKKALEMFNESRGRILSLASVHENLYQSEDMARIDFGDYIRDVTSHLFRTYVVDPETVRLTVNCSDVFLDITRAIPCGLIVNELISNSLKHAFPVGDSHEITIDFHPDEDNRLTLVVRDNGVGFPDDIDISSAKTLGMTLIRILVDQLHGTIEIEGDGGTVSTVIFGP